VGGDLTKTKEEWRREMGMSGVFAGGGEGKDRVLGSGKNHHQERGETGQIRTRKKANLKRSRGIAGVVLVGTWASLMQRTDTESVCGPI
jgi:hypothetical protein